MLDYSPSWSKCRVMRFSLTVNEVIALICSHEVDDDAIRKVDRLIKMKTAVYDARVERAHAAIAFGEAVSAQPDLGANAEGCLG